MKQLIFLLLFLTTGLLFSQNELVVKNLASNSEYSDFGGDIINDSTIIFTSARKINSKKGRRLWKKNKQPLLRLFKGTLTNDNEITNIDVYSENIKARYHESTACFTKDGKTVYFTRNNYDGKWLLPNKNGVALLQLYRATIAENGKWTNITPLPFNSDNFETGHPFLNEAEDRLYFSSNMPGSYGDTDIYYVDIINNGSGYGTPVNLGPNVNTPAKESFPSVFHNILVFASSGHEGNLGNLDLYYAPLVNDKAQPAQHFEGDINSPADDFELIFIRGKNEGFFASSREGGKGSDDVYYFKNLKINGLLFEGEKGDCTNNKITGIVRDAKTTALLPETLVVLFNDKGEKVESTVVGASAEFKFDVDCNKEYTLVGYRSHMDDGVYKFTTNDSTALTDVELTLNDGDMLIDSLKAENEGFITHTATDPELGFIKSSNSSRFASSIYFAYDDYTIDSNQQAKLDVLVRLLQENPEVKVICHAYTDSRGSQEYNLKLSQKRADSVKSYLESNGIDSTRIEAIGHGEDGILNGCTDGVPCSAAEHRLNRRLEFEFEK